MTRCGGLVWGFGVMSSLVLSIGFAQAQPSCQQLLEHLDSSFRVARSVTSTVNIRSGVVEIAYNRSRFDRQGDDLKVTLLEQRGRRTPYDQDVFATNPPADSQRADNQREDGTVALPFDCAQHDLTRHGDTADNPAEHTVEHTASNNHSNNESTTNDTPRYVLSLQNLQGDIPVEYWRLEFTQVGTWYVLERLFAPFSITILNVPVRGHFTMAFDSWDLPARLPQLPTSPRERLN
jgi:hypothetical protein